MTKYTCAQIAQANIDVLSRVFPCAMKGANFLVRRHRHGHPHALNPYARRASTLFCRRRATPACASLPFLTRPRPCILPSVLAVFRARTRLWSLTVVLSRTIFSHPGLLPSSRADSLSRTRPRACLRSTRPRARARGICLSRGRRRSSCRSWTSVNRPVNGCPCACVCVSLLLRLRPARSLIHTARDGTPHTAAHTRIDPTCAVSARLTPPPSRSPSAGRRRLSAGTLQLDAMAALYLKELEIAGSAALGTYAPPLPGAGDHNPPAAPKAAPVAA